MFQSLYNEARRSVMKRIESKTQISGNFFRVIDYAFQISPDSFSQPAFHPPCLFILSKNSIHLVYLGFQSKLISNDRSRFLHTTLTYYYNSTKHSWFWWKFTRGKGWGDGYWKVNKMYVLFKTVLLESHFCSVKLLWNIF